MSALLRHLAAILALPFVMALVIPTLLVIQTDSYQPGWGLPTPLNLLPPVFGLALLSAGLALLFITVKLFITVGHGTLAPWDPTQRLVVVGIYRHVRNPMISGVWGVLLGEAALLGSLSVLLWSLAFIGTNMLYIPLLEEPGLYERFGAEYANYARNVPRWLPRRTPWEMPTPSPD